MNEELKYYLSKLNVRSSAFEDFSHHSSISEKLPFASLLAKPAFYDCFSPLIEAYKFKLKLLDDNIQKLSGKMVSSEAILKQKLKYQNELNSQIHSIFEEFEKKEQMYLARQGSLHEDKSNLTGNLEGLLTCPVDMISLVDLKKDISEIEAENERLLSKISELNDQIALSVLACEEKETFIKGFTESDDKNQKLEDAKFEKIKLERELENLKSTNSEVRQKNESMSLEILKLQDEEFRCALELAKSEELAKYEEKLLKEELSKEQSKFDSQNKKYQDIIEHEKIIDAEIHNQRLEIFNLETDMVNSEGRIEEKRNQISEVKELKNKIIGKLESTKSQKNEIENKITLSREEQLRQELDN